jgi:hypothetical protein
MYVTNLYDDDHVYQYVRIGFMLMDAGLFFLIYSESLQYSFPDSIHGSMCLAGIVFTAWVVGKVLAEYILLKNDDNIA